MNPHISLDVNSFIPSLLHAQVRVAAYHHGHHNNNGHNAPHYKDSRALRDLKTKQNKHILSTYNKAYALFPKVLGPWVGGGDRAVE
jgi:hypothetical protein